MIDKKNKDSVYFKEISKDMQFQGFFLFLEGRVKITCNILNISANNNAGTAKC